MLVVNCFPFSKLLTLSLAAKIMEDLAFSSKNKRLVQPVLRLLVFMEYLSCVSVFLKVWLMTCFWNSTINQKLRSYLTLGPFAVEILPLELQNSYFSSLSLPYLALAWWGGSLFLLPLLYFALACAGGGEGGVTLEYCVKGIVQWKLRWVEISNNGQVLL